MRYTVQTAWAKNDTDNKPFEDWISICGDVFVVADGVTRPHGEYVTGMAESLASRAAKIASSAIARGVAASPDPDEGVRAAVADANRAVGEYNRLTGAEVAASCVFVSGAVRDGRLHFAYLGDSLIVLLRGGVRIRLSEQQTSHLRVYGSTQGLKITRRQLLDTITNNISHPLGYGVVDGDGRAMDFLRAASVALQPGDRVILSSDGLDKFLCYEREDRLSALSAQEMIALSEPYDKPPYADRVDDKALVIIDIQ